VWRSFTVPWAPDERIERLRDAPDAAALISAMRPGIPGVLSRTLGNPYYTTKIPDLNNLQYSRYMDATATHRLRGPEDVSRYAAFISGVDPMEFGKYKILSPEQRHITFRYGDEVLYAIAVYLMSLEPPKNPDPGPPSLIARGRQIFERETCINCHVPPNYSSGKLTLAQGYTLPADHPSQTDIVNVSVGTDPGLATKTRKGTGFYKIPSLPRHLVSSALATRRFSREFGRNVRSRSAQAGSRARRMERAWRGEARDSRAPVRARAERHGQNRFACVSAEPLRLSAMPRSCSAEPAS